MVFIGLIFYLPALWFKYITGKKEDKFNLGSSFVKFYHTDNKIIKISREKSHQPHFADW